MNGNERDSHGIGRLVRVYYALYYKQYPLVNSHNYGKSPFLMGKSTINGHFQ